MAEAKHTPGPWEAGVHPANQALHLVKPVLFGDKVIVLPSCEGSHVALKNGADARLIAAAPDMLEALRFALPHLDNSDSPGGCDGAHAEECNHCLAIVTVRKAISKATGAQ